MRKKTLSRILALMMAISLLSTTAFAASFSALQEAIDGGVAEAGSDEHANGTKFNKENDTTDYYGYAWNQNESRWGIEAWDNGDTRNVALNEDVKFDKDGEDKDRSKINGGIAIVGDKNVAIELNGHEINLNPDAKLDAQSEKFVDKDGQEVSRENLNKGSVIWVSGGADLTVTDSTALKVDENGEAVLDEEGNFQYDADLGTGTIAGGNNVGGNWTYGGKNYEGWRYQGGGVTIYDASFTMKGGKITGSKTTGHGGGVWVIDDGQGEKSTVTLKNVTISNNLAGMGGGIRNEWGAATNIDGCVIKENRAQTGGGAYVGGQFIISNTKVLNNTASKWQAGVDAGAGGKIINCLISGNITERPEWGAAGGVMIGKDDMDTLENCVVCHNTGKDGSTSDVKNANGGTSITLHQDGSEWLELTETTKAPTCLEAGEGIYTCKYCGATQTGTIPATGHKAVTDTAVAPTCTGTGLTEGSHCSACGEVLTKQEVVPALGHEYGDWYVTREAQPGEAGEERRDCVRGDAFETRPIPALPMPIDFGDDLGGGAGADTTIEDEATPLAGLFTRADAIGYLWEQSGSPEAELSTFADVPEDHYWAVAIGWAEDMGIALPDEEGNFRPDDLVLRTSDEPEGELQEFLNRYAVFAGVELEPDELFIELDGAADDVIMGEDAQVIFDAFFAKLEKALAEQEKAA